MTERRLKYRLGIFLTGSHIGIVVLCLGLYSKGAFNVEELTTLLAVVIPVVSGYSTSVLTFFINDRHTMTDESKAITMTFAVFSFVVPLVLSGLIAASIVAKAFNQVFASFEDFKRILILIESSFAVYAGMFVYSLFPKVPGVAAEQKNREGNPVT